MAHHDRSPVHKYSGDREARRRAVQRRIRRRRLVALSTAAAVIFLILGFGWPGFITSALSGAGTTSAGGSTPGPSATGSSRASSSPSATKKATTSHTAKPGPLRTVTAAEPLRLKAYGDSVGGGLCWMMQQTVADYPVKLWVFYKPSTGLARPDYFSWPNKIRDTLGHSWGAMVFMSGANDGQGMTKDGEALSFGSAAWLKEYHRRVGAMMDLVLAHGIKRLYWVGMPGMSPASTLVRAMSTVNDVYQAEAAKRAPLVRYVNAWKILEGPDGSYVASYRQPDGVHLNDAGTRKLAAAVWEIIGGEWHFTKLSGSPSPAGSASTKASPSSSGSAIP
jgi:uncharacterized protein